MVPREIPRESDFPIRETCHLPQDSPWARWVVGVRDAWFSVGAPWVTRALLLATGLAISLSRSVNIGRVQSFRGGQALFSPINWPPLATSCWWSAGHHYHASLSGQAGAEEHTHPGAKWLPGHRRTSEESGVI